MKKNAKRTTKVVVAIMAAILMFFVPIGQMVSVADITEEPVISITEEVLSNAPTEIITTNIGSIVTTVPVTTAITTTTTVETTVTTTTTKIITEKKKVFIFKPETHYVHTKDCYWTECGIIEEITNTEDIEARLCDECCPDIEIVNLYEEPEIDYTETYTDYEKDTDNSEDYYNEDESESTYAAQGSYNISDWEYTLLCRIVSSEYGSDWVPVEEKAKIVASVMAMVYNPNYPDTIEGVLDVACVPWGFDKYYDYYMSDSIYAAVDYYFTSGAYDGWTCTSWSGDGTWNYFS